MLEQPGRHFYQTLTEDERRVVRREINLLLTRPAWRTIGWFLLLLAFNTAIVLVVVSGEIKQSARDGVVFFACMMANIWLYGFMSHHAKEMRFLLQAKTCRKKYVCHATYVSGPDDAGLCHVAIGDAATVLRAPRSPALSALIACLDRLTPGQAVVIHAAERPKIMIAIKADMDPVHHMPFHATAQ